MPIEYPRNLPTNIDHLIYTTPNLAQGMDEIEQLFGVRPEIGGHHPKYGTHNALLSIGENTYFEIMAQDPNNPNPYGGKLFDGSFGNNSKLTTWVMRAENIESLQELAVNNGLKLGAVESGQRQNPNGSILSWTLTDPYAFPFGGAIPFLIEWGNTPHPAKTVKKGGELLEFAIEHPEAKQVGGYLKLIGSEIQVTQGDDIKLTATIKTESGIVILK